MRRGEIWLVELDPVRGSEANKTRPCVIVSSDSSNIAVTRTHRGMVTVVPLTSSSRPPRNFQARVRADKSNGLSSDSTAQAEQIRAVDYSRFVRHIGILDWEQRAALDAAILTHLDL